MVQEETDTLPLAIVEIPEGQEVQMDAPAPAYEPAAHALHPAEFTVPEFVTVPAYPGAQMEQAETDVLPVADPVVEIPAGQDVQMDDPAFEYELTAHVVHVDEPEALENDPAAQAVHTELDVAPVDVAKDPGEQRVQLAPPETEYEPGWHCVQDGV